MDYCPTQLLTSHGSFQANLFLFKLVPSPFCERSTSNCNFAIPGGEKDLFSTTAPSIEPGSLIIGQSGRFYSCICVYM